MFFLCGILIKTELCLWVGENGASLLLTHLNPAMFLFISKLIFFPPSALFTVNQPEYVAVVQDQGIKLCVTCQHILYVYWIPFSGVCLFTRLRQIYFHTQVNNLNVFWTFYCALQWYVLWSSNVHYCITKRRKSLFGMPCTSIMFLMFFSCYLERKILLRWSDKIYFREITISQALVDRQKNVEDVR